MLSKLFNLIFSLLFISFIGGLQGNIFFIFWSIFIIFFILKFIKDIEFLDAAKIFIFIYWVLIIIFYQLSDYNWQVSDVDSDGHMKYIDNFDFQFVINSLLADLKNFAFWDVRIIVSSIWYSISKIISFISFEVLKDQESQRFLIFQINVFFQILSGFIFIDILKLLKVFIEKKVIFVGAIFTAFCNPGFYYYQGYVGKESLLSAILLFTLYFSVRLYLQFIIKDRNISLKFLFGNYGNIAMTIIFGLAGTLARPYFPFLLFATFNLTIYFLNIKQSKFINFIKILLTLILSFFGLYTFGINFINILLFNSAGILLTPNIFKITNYFDFPFQTFTASLTSLSLFIFAFKKALKFKFIEINNLIWPLLMMGASFGFVVAYENFFFDRSNENLAFFIPRTRLCIYQILIFLIIFKTMRIGFIANKKLLSTANEK